MPLLNRNECLATPSEVFLYSMLHSQQSVFNHEHFDQFFDQFEHATCFACREKAARYVLQRLQDESKQLQNREGSKYL